MLGAARATRKAYFAVSAALRPQNPVDEPIVHAPVDRGSDELRIPRGMNLGTWLFTLLKGRRVGADADGNIYYEERRPRAGYRTRRWVAYARRAGGLARATGMACLAALHHRRAAGGAATMAVGKAASAEPRPARPQATDHPATTTRAAQRARATGDYESWTPDN